MSKRYILQAAASAFVFPGLGQLAKGEWGKALAIILGFPLYLFLTVVITVLTSIWVGVVLGSGLLAFYFWNVYDAYTLRSKS
jgi:TM2 domain-containing membrane protein YozV